MKKTLWIDTRAGISGDRFAAALIGLGVPKQEMLDVIRAGGELLGGMMDAHTHVTILPNGRLAHQLHLTPLGEEKPIPVGEVAPTLEHSLSQAGVTSPYADFARNVLEILQQDATPPSPQKTVTLPIIGTAHTPYQHKAPYQPQPENVEDGAFYIQVDAEYAAATQSLETFSHIFVFSYLNRSLEPELSVRPPWKDDDKSYGTFATRSPNRPSPIGLTRVRLRRVEENRIYTGPLDLFDGTPILDIKPFIRSLDGAENDDPGNDGWLEGSDHLELHRLGIPHEHPSVTGALSHPQTLIALLSGIAWGLQHLEVELGSTLCTSPVETDPARELPSPLGAAILTALSPKYVNAEDLPAGKGVGYGLGNQVLEGVPNGGAVGVYII